MPSVGVAIPIVAGVAAAPAAVAASGMVGVDGATKVPDEAAVVPMDETATEALLGGRPPLRRSGSSSVLLSELPYLQRPLMSAEGFALGRDGTGAISSVASGSANGLAAGGAAAASPNVPGASAPGNPHPPVRRSNSVLSLLSGMPTLRGLPESPSTDRLLGLAPAELNDVDGTVAYRIGGPPLSMAGVGGGAGALGFGVGGGGAGDQSSFVVVGLGERGGSFDHLAGLSAVEDLEEPQAVAMQLQDAKWS